MYLITLYLSIHVLTLNHSPPSSPLSLPPGLTFSADLDGAAGSDPVAVLVPLPGQVLQGHLAHEDGILLLLDVEILQVLHHLQLVLCQGECTRFRKDKSRKERVRGNRAQPQTSYRKPPMNTKSPPPQRHTCRCPSQRVSTAGSGRTSYGPWSRCGSSSRASAPPRSRSHDNGK